MRRTLITRHHYCIELDADDIEKLIMRELLKTQKLSGVDLDPTFDWYQDGSCVVSYYIKGDESKEEIDI